MAIDKLIDNITDAKTPREFDEAFKQLTQYADANGIRGIKYESEIDRYAPLTKYTVSYTKLIDEARGNSTTIVGLEEVGRDLTLGVDTSINATPLDEEIEEIFEVAAERPTAAHTEDDTMIVAVGTNNKILIKQNGTDDYIFVTPDEAIRLLEKLNWALDATAALNEQAPF